MNILRNTKAQKVQRKLATCIFILSISLFSTAFTSCSSDDDNDSGGSSAGVNSISVRVTNTGSENIYLDSGLGTDATGFLFCYANRDCVEVNGAMTAVLAGATADLEISPREYGRPNGVKVSLEIGSGSGYFEIVEGRSYDDDGWEEFDPVKVLFTSQEYNTPGVVEFTWGNIQ